MSAADAASLVMSGPSLKTAPSVPVPGHLALSAIRCPPGRAGRAPENVTAVYEESDAFVYEESDAFP